jgi:protoporphyrin/coproporphyrin ferrochelatase
MSFAAEPPHAHDQAERTAVLLTNLGTPEAPTAAAVRKYLAEFLSDRRVVEIPRALWWPILHGIVLRTRPAKSASKYASIWTREGSPLATWTRLQADRLRGSLGERGLAVLVRSAMRYGQPSIASGLDALKAQGATRILVMPMYPQYSAATTASTFDAVATWSARVRRVPELRVVNQFHDDEAYIAALASRVTEHWMREGRGRMLVMSFHGLPARTLALGDPYHCQCQKTARLLAERLGLKPEEYRLTFQSRFGRARWLEPYTDATLRKLAREGHERADVVCPGFTSDCLETLEEIAIEGRNSFLSSGGKAFHTIACLNDHPAWIAALAKLAIRHLQGWPTQAPSLADLQQQRERAIAAGAVR